MSATNGGFDPNASRQLRGVVRVTSDRAARGMVGAINDLAKKALLDLQANVPIKTGLLVKSYRIIKKASMQSPLAEVGSKVDYAPYQYPFRNNPRSGQPGLFQDGRVASREYAKINAIAARFVTDAIAYEIRDRSS